MNAAESAPSANRSRRRFGTRNATLNASVAIPAPKNAAITCSRARPSTRDAMVAIETRPASATTRGFEGGGAGAPSASGRTLGATPGAASFDPVSAPLLGSRDMTPIQAAILGVIQGLSEFLPISSSAHLALSHWLFGWGDPADNVPFDVALHLGTLIAVLLYFRNDLLALA